MSAFGFLPEAFAGASFSDTGASVNGNNGSRAAGSSGGWGAQANYQGLAMTPDGDCQDLTATYTTGPGALGNMSSLFSSLAPQYSTTVDYGSQANKGTGYVNWGSSQFIGGTGNIGNNAGGTAVNNGSTLAYGYNSTAIGCAVRAYGFGSTAMGFGAMAQDSGGIAMGIYSSSQGNGSIAIGTLATAIADHAIALGYGTNASGVDSLALGTSASATAASSLALGTSAVATAGNSVALGANSSTTANLAAAGYNPGTAALSGVASATNGEVSIGASTQERRLTNLAAGSQATDAVNVSQLQSEDAKVANLAATAASALGTTVGTNAAITAPSYLLAKANTLGGTSGAATNVGAGFDKVDGALGNLDGRVTQNTTDIAANGQSIAGLDTRVTQNTADISSNATSITSLGGRMTTAEGDITSLDGRMGSVEGDITSITTNLSSGAIGMVQQSAAGENLTVGKDSDGAAVDFLGTAGARKLINVADGAVAADSQEAVNGGQLFSTNQDVAQNTTDIAGNTAAITGLDGRVTQNSSDIASNAASITGLDGRMGSVEGDITSITTNLSSGTIGMVQQSAAGENLTVGKDSDGAAVDFLGTAGARKLINVADGTVAADSKEAVNGGQLFSTNQDVAQNTTDIAGNTAAITGLDGRVTQNSSDIASNAASITGLDGRMGSVEGDITSITTNLSSGAIGMVQQSAAGENLTVGKDSDGAAVDFLGTAGARKLINVADGTVAADSKEAVNGGQLFSTNQDVAQNTTDIAGNTAAITGLDGRVTQNSSDIASNAASITGLDGRMGSVEGDITSITTNLSSGTIGMVQQSAAGENLTVGKDSDGLAVDFLGTAGARKLINVADGAVAADSKEAVNGGQLFSTNQDVAQNTADIAGNTAAITGLDGRVNNVEGNVTNLDGRMNNVEGNITSITTNLSSGAIGMVQQSAAGENLTVGKDSDGAAVDFLGTAGARKLINMADGAVAADSQEAVNGGQLFSTNQDVAQNTADIAGNTAAITGLDGRVNNVEGSVTNLDGRMNNVEGDITSITTNLSSGAIGMVQQSAAGENLTVGKDSDGAAVDFLGTAGARKLINVADGTVAADSQEAVNGGQLFSTNQGVAQNTADIAGNTAAITGLDGRVTQNSSDIASNAASISGLDGRMGSVEGDITSITTNLSSGTIGMVQQSAAGENLTVGKDSDGAAVDFLGTAGARKLINVADGAVAADSQEAVNGGQLFSTNQGVAQNTADIAGNTAAITGLDGRVTQNSSDIASNAASISGLDGRMGSVEGDITSITTNLSSGTIGMVQQSAAGENLTVGKDSDGAAVDFLGTAGARKLINVADGTVAADSKEAVNGGQLFSTNQDVAQNTADIAGNTVAISGLDGRVTGIDSRVTNVEGSVTNLGGRMNNVEGDITSITTNLSSGTIGMVQQSAAGENLTVGKDSDGAAVDFLGTAGARKLINVADGTVAADSQEAMNGGQLFSTNQRVEQNATDIAGNTASIGDLNTRTTQNTADIAGNTVAISGLDGRVTQNTTDISGINTTLASMSGTLSDALVYDSAAHDKMTLGSTGKSVQLTNVKAGQLSEDSTDAVNGAQLFDTNNKVAVIDGRVTGLESSVNNMVSGGGIKYFHTSSTQADSVASGANAIAVGGNAKASGDGAVALGEGAEASANGSVALGQGASDGGRGAPAEAYVGQYSGASNDNVVGTVSVGNAATGETRTISNVADAQEAGDAVNLRQLDGAVAASKSYTDSRVDGIAGSVANVDETIANVDNRVTKVEDSVGSLGAVNNTAKLQKPTATGTDAVAIAPGAEASGASSTAVGSNAKAKGKNSVAVGANSVAERDNSVAVGSAGNERQITHVAAGVERTDAVNVGQVEDALGSLAGQTSSQFNNLRNDLKEQDDRLSAGIAGAIAIASLPQPMSNGGSTTSAGIGNFNGQSAVSVGVSHTSYDGKWTTKVGGSVDTQSNFSLGAGVGYNW
ncbi:YadA-like family protein [Pseudomonas sp. NBRC 111135]|nr:YadA-like family protein [Pseudomonas sp. NBRC 111135]